ncbi:sugar phosphate isomerase/epimerase family protein [Bengtsoniella intestinalis]|uniref:sugar phosphate isomerase/epimerase family protein n=1 Tax=Bengtsoniella intestinalis TaxID=3073143 RepID=UPI00391F7F44
MIDELFFSSTLLWGCDAEELFAKWNHHGIKHVELWAEQVEATSIDPTQYKILAQAHGITTVIHSKSWDLNFASLNAAIRQTSLDEIKKSFDLAVMLGAKEVTVHPPRHTITSLDPQVKQLAYDGIRVLHLYGKERGVALSLEIMEKIPKELITSDLELKDVVGDLYHQLEYTVDTAHCTDEEELLTYMDTIDHVSKIHISNKVGTKLHTPLYHGDFDFHTLLFKLLSYGVPLSVEGLDKGPEYSLLDETVHYIRKLEKKSC